MKRSFGLVLLIPVLAGCAAGSTPLGPPPPPVTQMGTVPPPRAPARSAGAGLGGVLDATAAQLVQKFGKPRIDLTEGDARKLQFAGPPCVLDVYLYTPEGGREQRATWVDARNLAGESVDPAACIGALGR